MAERVRAAGETGPVSFGQSFVHSEAFQALFQEGMELVEEAAAYLDGPGRTESQELSREAALAYASESMRLTTGLMQIASWLLLQRAVAEGDLEERSAERERRRLRLGPAASSISVQSFERLPRRLRQLIGLTARLQARIRHLDVLLRDAPVPLGATENPVALQHRLLQRVFRARA